MDALAHLIKERRRDLEGLQRKMSAVDMQVIALRASLSTIDRDLDEQAKAAALSPEAGAAFAAFFARARQRREAAETELSVTPMAADRVSAPVAETFREIKGFEAGLEPPRGGGRLTRARKE